MRLGREARRALVAELAVRSKFVVLTPVVLNHHSGFGKRPELFPVQALVAEASVEALYEPVLPGASRLDVDGLDSLLGQPSLHDLGDKLAPVVAAQVFRCAVLLDRFVQPFQHVGAP